MADEQLYQIAYNDFSEKEIDQAIWIKAMALAGGDKQRAKWHYVELRVEQMMRDPALRKTMKPAVLPSTSSSGAFMIWFGLFLFSALLFMATGYDFGKLDLSSWSGTLSGFEDLSSINHFLDLPSLVMVLAPTVFFGIAASSWTSYWRSWSYPLGWRKKVGEEDARSTVRCLKVMGDVSLVMGIIASLIGGLTILRELESIKQFGGPVSVMALGLLYGIIFKLIAYVAENRVRNLYLNS